MPPENCKKAEWLRRYQKINRRINRKCEEVSQLRELATKITPTLSDMPKGNQTSDKVSEAVSKIADLEKEIDAEVDALVAIRNQIQAAIEAIQDDTLKTLLEYRYIDGLTWEKIAVKMNYSYMHVCRLHGKAINVIECYTPPVI